MSTIVIDHYEQFRYARATETALLQNMFKETQRRLQLFTRRSAVSVARTYRNYSSWLRSRVGIDNDIFLFQIILRRCRWMKWIRFFMYVFGIEFKKALSPKFLRLQYVGGDISWNVWLAYTLLDAEQSYFNRFSCDSHTSSYQFDKNPLSISI